MRGFWKNRVKKKNGILFKNKTNGFYQFCCFCLPADFCQMDSKTDIADNFVNQIYWEKRGKSWGLERKVL
jgi:hypothetical protein